MKKAILIFYSLIVIALTTFFVMKKIHISISFYFFCAITISLIILLYLESTKKDELAQRKLDDKLKEIEKKGEATPEKTKYSWDIARIKLEAYFDRNLSQINLIFWISIFVMIAGLVFIIWGITMAMKSPEVIKITYIASGTGIITEFIGATFMLIYRSTIRQASINMNVLERINSVGMAIQILDSIPESNEQLKSQTKAEITKLLLENKVDKN